MPANAECTPWKADDAEIVLLLGNRIEGLSDLVHVALEIVEVGVLRRVDHREQDALILLRRQFLGRRPVHEAGRHQHADEHEDGRRAIIERIVQSPLVARPQAVEHPVEKAREAALRFMVAQQLRRHHRRQGEGHDARNDDRAGEREGEFAEQRAGQSGGEADRRIDGGQRDGHADDRQRDLAGSLEGCVERLHPLLDVPVDVLDHHDGVVDDEADRQHQRQQGEQIDRIAHRQQHHEDADERQREW